MPRRARAFPLVACALLLACEHDLVGPVREDRVVATDEPIGGYPEPGPRCDAAERFDELLERLETEIGIKQLPGAAVALACADGTVISGGVGVSRAGQAAPITGRTRFQIASVTKTLTAATAVLLEEEGVLDRSAPLDALLSDMNTSAPYARSFTLAELLAHSAGFPTEMPTPNGWAEDLEGLYTLNDDVQLWSEPGRVYNYANYGYGLAGLAMERAANEPFANLVQSRLMQAHGLEDMTMSAQLVNDEGGFAFGHTGTAAAPQVHGPLDHYYDAGWYGPMGGAWSSAESLAAFGALLLDERDDAPGAALRDALTEWHIRSDMAPDVGYGQGLFLDETGTSPRWHHGGGVDGFVTSFQVLPDSGLAIAIIVNGDWAFPEQTERFALEELGGWEPGYEWGEVVIDDVVGTYVDDLELGTVRIVTDDAAVVAHFDDLGFEAPMTSWDTDTALIYYEPWQMEVTLTFWRDETGAVDLLSTMAGVASRSQ
jgi:CubicO group peptidase (beta-lactamase class C family)